MAIFKIDAEGDTVYIEAKDKTDAYGRLCEVMGPIPQSLLTFTQIKKLPTGEELL